MKLFNLVTEFLESEKAGGFVLILCTIVSLILSNSFIGESYISFWNLSIGGHLLVHWINDGLMTFFFLLIGVELKREFMEGQFQHLRKALLPIFAAVGGMLIPAGIHLLLNFNSPTQSGAGIPMATDAAFALAILSLVEKRAPFGLKMLLLAIAVIDDLFAVILIAVFYTADISWFNLGLSLLVFLALMTMSKFGMKSVITYVIGGILMWYFMLHSGVHATLAGVLLAIALPFKKADRYSVSMTIQHHLHKPVAFFILPLFALANTSIAISGNMIENLSNANSMGIILGLVVGKPAGVFLFSLLAVKIGVASLHSDLSWKHVFGIGILAGIGFTISIFISLLAFTDTQIIDQSKMAVLAASVVAAVCAYVWLNRSSVIPDNN
jgi:NhaA family Na+:H+ antiporter